MSGYKPYPKYKDSGFKWLREVPEHWEIVQSRRLFTERKDRSFQGDRQLTASQKHGILYQEDFALLEGVKVMQVILGLDLLKHVEPNDFVISMRSFQGGLEWSGLRGSISSAYVMLIPNESIYAGYFKWAFKSQPYLQALQSTSNLVRDGQALRFDNFAQVHLPVVPFEEQKSIATFLDRETSKLDILIREQKDLITLLQEKRQALISNAVTKGLNPQAKMKDSGVEWLGEVPEHWSHLKIKHICNFSGGATPSTEIDAYWDGNIPWVTSKDMKSEFISDSEDHISQAGLDSCSTEMLPIGCVIICARSGILKHTIPIAITTVPVSLNQDIRALQFNPKLVIPEFILRWVQGLQEELLFAWRKQGATVESLEHDYIARQSMFLPPLTEQKLILGYLFQKANQLDSLIKEAEETIDLMHEHRASLISEAVTGKIDVRKQA